MLNIYINNIITDSFHYKLNIFPKSIDVKSGFGENHDYMIIYFVKILSLTYIILCILESI